MDQQGPGRPSVMTPEILQKLEQAFSIGCTDAEACLYADIATSTLYAYCKENPRFSERKEELKHRPVLKARKTVFENLSDPQTAKWFLERKRKNEFGERKEITGADGIPLTPPVIHILPVAPAAEQGPKNE